MAANESNGAHLSPGVSPSYEAHRRPRFKRSSEFQAELRRRVDEYLETHSGRKQDCPQMYLKTAIILSTFGVSYWLLVFVATAWWQAVPLALLLGLAMAGIGFNIQHDAGHHAYSRLPWMNRLMSMTLDMVGGSSYLWHWKHVVFHHTYVNITGHDTDIDLGILGRLTPHQKRYRFHRFQFLYLWPLYGVIVLKWHLFDDFVAVLGQALGEAFDIGIAAGVANEFIQARIEAFAFGGELLGGAVLALGETDGVAKQAFESVAKSSIRFSGHVATNPVDAGERSARARDEPRTQAESIVAWIPTGDR